MGTTDHFAAYFSHSWSDENVAINLMLWEQLAARCCLLIDKPQPVGSDKRPYFISRIESLIRRSDVFIACLPAYPPSKRPPWQPQVTGDWRYNQSSPYILFELRLAERSDLPRFVLYDQDSRFQPPARPAPHVYYVGRRFDELRKLIAAGGQDRPLVDELERWLAWVTRNRVPEAQPAHSRAAYLLGDDPPGRPVRGVVAETVERAGFDKPQALDTTFHTDAELCQSLRELDLLVVDVARPELLPLYHAAHALLVPTIRIHSGELASAPAARVAALPSILRGHPAGYQEDLVGPATEDGLSEAVHHRATANLRAAEPVIGFDRGRFLLYERTYPGPPHFVFLSHDQKLDDRTLIDEIVAECGHRGVTLWEYSTANRAGDTWPRTMSEALERSTHMVLLLSPGYEQSRGCSAERDYAIKHGLKLLPFLTHGRVHPSVELYNDKLTHEPLTRSPQENARRVVERVRAKLMKPDPA